MPLELPDEDTGLPLPLEPLAYHKTLVNHLAAREAELWTWFAAEKLREPPPAPRS